MLDVFTHYSFVHVMTREGNFHEIILVYPLFLCNDAVEIRNVPLAGRHLTNDTDEISMRHWSTCDFCCIYWRVVCVCVCVSFKSPRLRGASCAEVN